MRVSGLYLARRTENSDLEVISRDSKYPTEVYSMGWDMCDHIKDYFWIDETPLDLEQILKLNKEK